MRFLRVSETTAAIVALVLSVYNFWQNTLQPSTLSVFVPPVISYASPFQNSNFEAFTIPITITNDGARTGTLLSMTLVVTDPTKNISKRFYSANFGRWTNDKYRNGDLEPFAPISLPARTSHTETVQFYARSDEKVMQIVQDAGRFQFALSLDAAISEDLGFVDRFLNKAAQPLTFEMVLPELDHRAFTSGAGTVMLHQKDWQSSVRAD
jgi:hypothetical protein